MGGLIGTVSTTKDGLIKKGYMSKINVSPTEKIKVNITSCSILISQAGGSIVFLSAYAYTVYVAKALSEGNLPLLKYDTIKHNLYIYSDMSTEIGIIPFSQEVYVSQSTEDVSLFSDINITK